MPRTDQHWKSDFVTPRAEADLRREMAQDLSRGRGGVIQHEKVALVLRSGLLDVVMNGHAALGSALGLRGKHGSKENLRK